MKTEHKTEKRNCKAYLNITSKAIHKVIYLIQRNPLAEIGTTFTRCPWFCCPRKKADLQCFFQWTKLKKMLWWKIRTKRYLIQHFPPKFHQIFLVGNAGIRLAYEPMAVHILRTLPSLLNVFRENHLFLCCWITITLLFFYSKTFRKRRCITATIDCKTVIIFGRPPVHPTCCCFTTLCKFIFAIGIAFLISHFIFPVSFNTLILK